MRHSGRFAFAPAARTFHMHNAHAHVCPPHAHAQAASNSFKHSMAPEKVKERGLAGVKLWLAQPCDERSVIA